jgi:hypothetical protein
MICEHAKQAGSDSFRGEFQNRPMAVAGDRPSLGAAISISNVTWNYGEPVIDEHACGPGRTHSVFF